MMVQKRNRSVFPGIMLIIFGVILLIEKLELDSIYVDWALTGPIMSIIFGLHLWSTAFSTDRKGKVFPGTFFLVLGLFFLAWNIGMLEEYFYFDEFWPIFFLAIGLSFLSLFVTNLRNWFSVFPAAFFLSIGVCSFLYYTGYIDWWDIEDFIYNLGDKWYLVEEALPLLIVLAGVFVIFKSLRKSRARKNIKEIEENGPII